MMRMTGKNFLNFCRKKKKDDFKWMWRKKNDGAFGRVCLREHLLSAYNVLYCD